MRTASLLFAVLLAPALARADIPPPEGYVETCVSTYYERDGINCEDCSTWHSDENRCAQREELAGMQVCCRTRGASVWSEVWCEGSCPEPVVPAADLAPAAPATPPAAEADDDGGCAVGRGATAPWLVLTLAALFVARRRR